MNIYLGITVEIAQENPHVHGRGRRRDRRDDHGISSAKSNSRLVKEFYEAFKKNPTAENERALKNHLIYRKTQKYFSARPRLESVQDLNFRLGIQTRPIRPLID